MIKIFLPLTCLLFFVSTTFSQRIAYSSNRLISSSHNHYNVVGEVKGNIIIWKTFFNKHFKAKILVYDNSMKLLHEVSTNILSSGADPQPQFFVTDNYFWVTYQYKSKKSLAYRLACFDENGNIKSIRNLDSIQANDQALLNETFFYKTLQSENKKIICFSKMYDDTKNHVLKFDCSYISDTGISYQNFVMPFNEMQEDFAGITVDNNYNIVLLKTSLSADSIYLRLIKKEYQNNIMLAANKVITDYHFQRNLINVSERSNGYIVFGDLKKGNDSSRKFGLYIWQTDSLLNDDGGDTTIYKTNRQRLATVTANISTTKRFSNVFATWDISNMSGTFPTNYNHINSKDNLRPSFVATAINPTYGPNIRARQDGALVPPSYIQYQQGTPGYINDNQLPMVPATAVNLNQVLDNRIELFRLDNNNKIVWNNIFKDSADEITTNDFGKSIVIAGNNAIHIIYEIHTDKRTTSLNQVIVHADGSYTTDFFAAWKLNYDYNLNESVLVSETEFIVPATSGARIKFAKMKVE